MNGPNPRNSPWQDGASPFGMTPVTPQAASAMPGVRPRPGGLTAICVLAIVLGALGLLMGCASLLSQLFASQMQKAISGMQAGANPAAAEAQEEMNAKVLAITRKYTWVTVPLSVAKLVVEGALLAGAIMSLGLKPLGRRWLIGALVAAIVVETVLIVPTLLAQHETLPVTAEMMPKLMQEAQQGANKPPPGFDQLMTTLVSAIGVVSIVMALVWLASKVAFYVIGIVYLRKSHVAALFAPPAVASTEWR